MAEAFAVAVFVVGLAALAYGWQQARMRQLVRDRLGERPGAQPELEMEDTATSRPFVRRHWFLPWLAGAATAAVLYFGVGLHEMFSIMFGVIVGLLGGLLDSMRVGRIAGMIETQLANAIDLMVGALRAGASLPAALESALVEVRWPLKPELEEVLGRLRLGDDPPQVFGGLMQRVPLETFRLFSATLATHWEVGGSLASTLATVGRTIRDRIEVSRRIRSLTTQSRVSILAILGATYFIALVMWRNDADRMSEFLATEVGRWLVTVAVMLQAVGIVWSSQIGKVKY